MWRVLGEDGVLALLALLEVEHGERPLLLRGVDLIAEGVCDKYSVRPSIRPIHTQEVHLFDQIVPDVD